jgi:hypothetical protein
VEFKNFNFTDDFVSSGLIRGILSRGQMHLVGHLLRVLVERMSRATLGLDGGHQRLEAGIRSVTESWASARISMKFQWHTHQEIKRMSEQSSWKLSEKEKDPNWWRFLPKKRY